MKHIVLVLLAIAITVMTYVLLTSSGIIAATFLGFDTVLIFLMIDIILAIRHEHS